MKAMRLRYLGVFALALVIGGCSVRGSALYEIEGNAILYAVDGGEAAFLIYTDIQGGSQEDGAMATQDEAFSGRLTNDAGLRIDYHSDGSSLTIAGQEYDLANGRVFLLQTRGVSRTAQLPIGRNELEHSNDDMIGVIRALAEAREEIRMFLWPPEIA